MKQFRILITSWGTSIPLDDVRSITNFSQWTTGTLLTQEALKRGHKVDFIHSKNSKLPFIHQIDPLSSDMDTIQWNYKKLQKYKKNLAMHEITTYDDYEKTLLATIKKTKPEIAIASMAVSDFWITKKAWKISSKEALHLDLEKLTKIIDNIRKVHPHVFLVWFKLMVWVSHQELIEQLTVVSFAVKWIYV